MTSKIFKAVCLSLLFGTAGGFAAQGLTVFHVGNSLTDETYYIHTIAQGFGNTWNSMVYSRSMIPGAPIRLLWEENVKKTNDKNTGNCGFFYEHRDLAGSAVSIDQTYPNLWSTSLYLRAKPMDVLILQIFPGNADLWVPMWGTDEYFQATKAGVLGYPGDAYQGNPDCQAYLYASHTMNVGKLDSSMTDPNVNYVNMRETINQTYPTRKPACIIPAPLAFNKMLADGYGDLWVPDGHANANGKYLLATLFYAIIYKKNPAGAIAPTEVTASYKTKIQEVVWNIATTYPYTGVGSTPVLKPAAVKQASRVSAAGAKTVNLAGRSMFQDRSKGALRPAIVLHGASAGVWHVCK